MLGSNGCACCCCGFGFIQEEDIHLSLDDDDDDMYVALFTIQSQGESHDLMWLWENGNVHLRTPSMLHLIHACGYVNNSMTHREGHMGLLRVFEVESY